MNVSYIQPEDWYSVTLTDLKDARFPASVTRIKLCELLQQKYPDFKWELVYLLRGRYAQQKRLERAVASLFPVGARKEDSSQCTNLPTQDTTIIQNARKEAELVNPATDEFLELDVYVPSLNLAFEYQVCLYI